MNFDESKVYSLLFANISLEGVAHWLSRAEPVLTALLTVLQIVVAGVTVYHIINKQIEKRSHEKNPPSPPDSTGADI